MSLPTPPNPLHRARDLDPPTLTPAALRAEQQVTLSAPPRPSHIVVAVLTVLIGLLYGRRASLPKFLVLEHLARVPYRSWERVAQRRIIRAHGRSALARRIQLRVDEARSQHDNEQWHLLVLEEQLARGRHRLPRLRFRVLPRLLAGPWHMTTWLLHLVKPAWSYGLNAAFEDHAEREYMHFVAANPQFEHEPFDSELADRWDHSVSVADVLRQIGHDERIHKLESISAARAERSQSAEDTTKPTDLDAAA